MRRRLQLTRWIVVAVTVTTIVAGGLLSPRASAAFRYLQEGMTAPELEGKDLLTGEKVTSNGGRDEDGAIIVIAFWATWSQRSIEILEDLKTMTSEYAGHPFRVIAVNVESQSISSLLRDKIKAKVIELEVPFPVIVDENLEIFDTFGVVAVPSTALIDTDGTLLYGPAGYSYVIRDRLADSTQVLLGLKERSEADETLKRGYVPKKRAARYYNLAVQLNRKRMYERALDNLDRAVAADTAFSAPANLKGQIMLTLGRPDEAVIEFEHAVALDESSVAAWAGWGRALYRNGDAEAAREKLKTALDLDESYAPAMLDRALCLLSDQKVEEALAFLDSARELNPRDPGIYLILGRHHEAMGRRKEALEAYRAALEILHPVR